MSAAKEDDATPKGFNLALLRRVTAFGRPYRRQFVASGLLLLLLSGLSLMGPLVVRHAIDTWVNPQGAPPAVDVARHGILVDSVIMALLGIATFGLRYQQIKLINRTGQQAIHDLRMATFRHIQSRSLRFFDQNPVGKLVTRVTNDVEALNEIFTAGVDVILYDALRIAVIVAILFCVDARLAGVTLAVVPLIGAWSFVFQRAARRLFRAVRSKITALNTFTNESLAGVRVVQAFRREVPVRARFAALNATLRDEHVRTVKNYSLFFPGMEFLSALGTAAIVYAGAGLFRSGSIRAGDLFLFWMLFNIFVEPLRQLADKFNILQAALAAGERVFRVLDDAAALPIAAQPVTPARLSGDIVFDDVSFSYDGRQPVLKHINIHVEPGQRIALVGPTGSGKSSIINLLLRFCDADAGRVLLDGHDVRTLDQGALRRQVGVVLQDTFLFAGTVRDNLALGDATLTDERLWAAARTVQADGIITRLGGLGAAVMERGATLSTGEKQLLAFARTLAHNPAVLVLDEATASIDTESERLIQTALDKLLEGRTSLIVAHRLSTIRRADQILVLHHGEIREAGTQQQLLAADGLYARLHRLQFKE